MHLKYSSKSDPCGTHSDHKAAVSISANRIKSKCWAFKWSLFWEDSQSLFPYLKAKEMYDRYVTLPIYIYVC